MGKKTTSREPGADHVPAEPWQAWGTTIRYTVIRIAIVLPAVAVAWWVVGHH